MKIIFSLTIKVSLIFEKRYAILLIFWPVWPEFYFFCLKISAEFRRLRMDVATFRFIPLIIFYYYFFIKNNFVKNIL